MRTDMPVRPYPILPQPGQWLIDQRLLTQAESGAVPHQEQPYQERADGHGKQCCSGVSMASVTVWTWTSTLPGKTPMTQKLHFSHRELKSAFSRFVSISKNTSTSLPIKKDFPLYTIYAVECGLRYLLLENLRKDTTERLDDDYLTHDLNYLLKIVGINKKLPPFQRKAPRKESAKKKNIENNITSGKLHELYRYGGRLDSECENDLMKHLLVILTKIEELMRI